MNSSDQVRTACTLSTYIGVILEAAAITPAKTANRDRYGPDYPVASLLDRGGVTDSGGHGEDAMWSRTQSC